MAERPIFIPVPDSPELVRELSVPLVWNSGFAPIQKKKNIAALHAAAAKLGYAPLLEVSTKSEQEIGQRLSAFSLRIYNDRLGQIPLEAAFQGSKVFERGGPYTDLYTVKDVRDAKRDPRLRESGALKGFKLGNFLFPTEPKTVFYDWLYMKAVYEQPTWFRTCLFSYAGFTDIEFNPVRSINCQARSCALLVTLLKNGLLEEVVRSPGAFIRLLLSRRYRPDLTHHVRQELMFRH